MLECTLGWHTDIPHLELGASRVQCPLIIITQGAIIAIREDTGDEGTRAGHKA